MNQEKVIEIFERFYAENPEPKIELDYTNEFTLLVAIVLSAQTTDVKVNEATKALFLVANTPEKMLDLGEEKLKGYIKTLGLFNNKAKSVMKLATELVTKFNSKIPNEHTILETLPGVGRKTANVFLNVAHKQPTIGIDTHILRIAPRIGLAFGEKTEEIEEQLLKIIPDKYKNPAHHWLVLHGRYICKAKQPKCNECPIYDLCEWDEKGKY